ncbi:Cell invasion protein SipB [Sodalis glossinidius str. 'morsitans']|uniref:Cell invasion protein SipB n=3 Tax=Sodalis glossinidius TaxID=63612 RepID=Q2NVH6_SODGM|nr:YspB [Sodalis glossinidius]BAE73849.1 putative translocation machinery component [Sodalis glossinidius str. 'morsitans']CRL44296.1 Cell invasion protein SipB [Sodalis glossinidius str. 'morsitans']
MTSAVNSHSLPYLNEIFGHEEASNAVTKREQEAARRFGDERYAQHRLKNKVQTLQQSLTAEQLQKVIQETQRELVSKQPRRLLADVGDTPRLAAPAQSSATTVPTADASSTEGAEAGKGGTLSGMASLTYIMGNIIKLTGNKSLQQLSNNLAAYVAQSKGTQTAASAMSEVLKQATSQWAGCKDDLTAAQEHADQLQSAADQATQAASEALKSLKELQAQAAKEIADSGSVSPALQKKLDAAKALSEKADGEASRARAESDKFIINTLNPAISAEKSSRQNLDAISAKVSGFINALTPQQQGALERKQQKENEGLSLTYLLAVINELIGKSASEKLEASAELNKKLSAASIKEAKERAADFAAKQAKAEEMQKTMGCIGKIIGWIITVVSVAAAAFTGGASLALAGVGLSLAIGDEIGQAITGKSFMQEAMGAILDPIMKGIIQPLMQFYANLFSKVLEGLGLDKGLADTIGQIMGAIQAAVMMIAAVMMAGSLVKSIASKIGSTMIVKAGMAFAKRMLQNMGKKVAETLGKKLGLNTLTSFAKKSGTRLAKFSPINKGNAATVQKVVVVADVVNTTAQAGGNIAVAALQSSAAQDKADLLQAMATQELLKKMMDEAVNVFTHNLATMNEIMNQMSQVGLQDQQTKRFITQQIALRPA